jgi:uncharacterized protein YecE (DUF72 family)
MAADCLNVCGGNFFSGTSNLVLPVKNKSFLPEQYQDKTRLTYYASLFNSVEINSSFYRMPLARTVAKWATEVPDNFRFTFKLIQTVTHSAKRQINIGPIKEFIGRISAAGSKSGYLLVQLPPSFSVDILQLGELLAEVSATDKAGQWPLAIEFRHSSWYTDNVFELLHEHNAAMVFTICAKAQARLS